jgi:subtilisin-like proprotein convertase family protein
MKRISLTIIGIAMLLVQSSSAQVLFTTTNDFAMWQTLSGFAQGPVTYPDSDGSPVNGLGNTNAPGGAGAGGSLSVQWPQGGAFYVLAATASPGEQGFTNFFPAVEQPGMVMTIDYLPPPVPPGSNHYFQVGIVVNCSGRYDTLGASASTPTIPLGGGWMRAIIDWGAEAQALQAAQAANSNSFGYFQFQLTYNSDYSPTTPYYIDNITMRSGPVKLFTTTNDFTGWTTEVGFSNVGPTNFDLDGSTTNGIGNTTAPGALGTGGSLNITHASNNFGVVSYSPAENANTALITMLEKASSLSFDYTTPTAGTGTYFQAGITVNCQGVQTNVFPASTAAVSNGVTRANINWTAVAQALLTAQSSNGGGFTYFQLGIVWNSDYNPGTTPFQVDNITATTNATGAYIIPASSTVASEGCSPTNNAIDPGETVGVQFALQNTGSADASNVVATLLSSSGVVLPSTAQSYGTLVANGAAVTNSFTFTAEGTCGGNLVGTLQLQTNSVFYRTVPYSFTLGALGAPTTNIFSSGGEAIAIPDNNPVGITNSIAVTVTGAVSHVTVSVRVNHTYDGDLQMYLIGPDGTQVGLIQANPGDGGANFGSGSTDCNGTFTVFDDSASVPIAGGSSPFNGSYVPWQHLSTFNGKPALGTWKIYIEDTGPGDVGTLFCWQLKIAYQPFACCAGSSPTDPFTAWQSQYFTLSELGSPSFSGPGADPFGKGMSNTNQFLAGFNPTNAAAYVHITSISKTNSGTDIRVDYLGASGDSSRTLPGPLLSRTNVLEFTSGTANGSYSSNNFASTGVTDILSGGAGLGTLTNMVDPGGATNKPARYYRVRVLVP